MLTVLHCLLFLYSTQLRSILTLFSKTVLPISKNFVPEDKPRCQLLHNTSCKSEFVLIKVHTLNHILYKSFLSPDPISVISLVDVVNVKVKFPPFGEITLSSPACLCIKNTNNFNRKHSISSKCLQCSHTHRHIDPTNHLCKAPQYIHTVAVISPANTSHFQHEGFHVFFYQVQV